MKILRVIATIAPESGGPIEGLKQSSRVMTDEGVEVEIASLDSPDSEVLKRARLPWKLYPLGPTHLGTYSFSRRIDKWLDENVREYDAVIIHGNWQYHGLATANSCIKNQVPYFIFTHGMLDPWFNETYLRKKIKKQLYWKFEHRILSHAESVLFTSEEERLRARLSFSPYEVKEKVVGYGTNPPSETAQELSDRFKRSPRDWGHKPFLLFMSRIQEKKGLDILVEAYAKQRREKPDETPDLVIAGPIQQPEYADRIQSEIDQTGIHWVGLLTGEEKWQALASAEATILTSHQENFGIVIAESLSVSTPVLISNKVNIWREIQEMKAGIVADDTISGATELLQKWSEMSTSSRKEMSANARRAFDQFFDIKVTAQNLIDYIETTISPKPSSTTIAVVIPTYDRPEQLRRALHSCITQSILPSEILVIDNGSNSRTKETVDSVREESDMPIQYFTSAPFDLGQALSTGIDNVSSEWLLILDDDDYLTTDRIKNDLIEIGRCNTNDVALFHDAIRFDYGINFALWHKIEPQRLDLFHALTFGGLPPTPATTWRTETIKARHPYDRKKNASTTDYSLYAACLAHGRARSVGKTGYIMDDTRDRSRITTDWSHILDGIQEHRSDCQSIRHLSGRSDEDIDTTIDKHIAFFSGKYRGLGAFTGAYSREALRHPIETAKGWLSPIRSYIQAWVGSYLPIMKGSRSYTLRQLAKEDSGLAELIESQRLD